MENNSIQGSGGAASGTNGTQGGSQSENQSSDGNNALSAAFDKAIQQAQKTLEISTVKGADLYALKQRPQ